MTPQGFSQPVLQTAWKSTGHPKVWSCDASCELLHSILNVVSIQPYYFIFYLVKALFKNLFNSRGGQTEAQGPHMISVNAVCCAGSLWRAADVHWSSSCPTASMETAVLARFSPKISKRSWASPVSGVWWVSAGMFECLAWSTICHHLCFLFLSSFNPVAPTAMMKVLTRISAVEAGKVKRRPGAGDIFDFYL